MNIPGLPSHVKAAELPFEKLAASHNVSEQDKVTEACRQFEAIFLRQILQETRKTVIPSGSQPDTASAGIYADMVNSQLADNISQSGAFGLAKSLQAQLIHQALPETDAAKSGATLPSIAASPHKKTAHD